MRYIIIITYYKTELLFCYRFCGYSPPAQPMYSGHVAGVSVIYILFNAPVSSPSDNRFFRFGFRLLFALEPPTPSKSNAA
jgi:hypothetical protein